MKKINDLVNGPIAKSILLFSVPLLIGNLFQQLYSTVDSYIVGNYVGKQALAAVGASNPIVNALIGFFMGLATGAGVIISQYYGAKDDFNVKKAVHSSAALTIIMSIILTIIGLIATPHLLRLVNVPSDIFPESTTYLSIYFSGIVFILIYNMASGILRAIGDSKRPLYILITASLINIVLDIIFVRFLYMGVAGAGYATLISQMISSILVTIALMNESGSHRLIIKDIRFHSDILKRIMIVGLPTGFQQSLISLSNLGAQSYINAFGSNVVAGYSAGIRIDGFVFLPMQSFNMAITTFVGQNLGAKRYDRVKKGTKVTLLMGIGCILTISVFLLMFGELAIGLFNSDPNVIEAGRLMQLTFLCAYWVLPFGQILAGVLRGAGKSTIPMVVLVINYVIIRQSFLAIITQFTSEVNYVFMAWPLTWITNALMMIYFYIKTDFTKI